MERLMRAWSRGSGLDEEGAVPAPSGDAPPCAVPAAPPLPAAAEWRHRPLLMRLLTGGGVGGCASGADEVVFGREVAFAAPLAGGGALEGRMLVQRDVTRSGEDCGFSCVLQARFAEDTPAADVAVGLVFAHELHELRPRAMVEQAEALARRFVYAGVAGSLFASPPCLSLPLLAAADRVHVAPPGAPPPPLSADVAEDCAALGPAWASGGPACGTRQRLRRAASGDAAAVFPAGATVTCWFFSQKGALSLEDFAFALPLLPAVRWRLQPILRDMPIQFAMWRRCDGVPMFVFQMWHESLLPHAAQAALAPAVPRSAAIPLPVGAA